MINKLKIKQMYKDRVTFVQEIKKGMRVNTSMGNGVVESVIEDIGCHVNVLLDNGNISRNFMLDTLYYECKTLK